MLLLNITSKFCMFVTLKRLHCLDPTTVTTEIDPVPVMISRQGVIVIDDDIYQRLDALLNTLYLINSWKYKYKLQRLWQLKRNTLKVFPNMCQVLFSYVYTKSYLSFCLHFYTLVEVRIYSIFCSWSVALLYSQLWPSLHPQKWGSWHS